MTKLLMPPPRENSRPTIHDVAAALGMHKSTVSLGLSGKGTVSAATRERILQVAQEMGYEPNPVAQRLAGAVANKLVYVCACVMDVGIGTEKLLLIQNKLRRLGLEVPLYSVARVDDDPESSQSDEIKELCRQQPRAIVYAAQGCQPSVLPELQRYQENGGYVISYDWPIDLKCDQVVFDRQHNGYQAANYLLRQGHKKLGINQGVNPDFSPEEIKATNPRLFGFRRAVEEAGLNFDEQCFFRPGEYERGGAEMAHRFLEMKERPTGICVVNDYAALAFMSEVMGAGLRIPKDVSLVGHDNQLVARYCPVPLTSANQPVEEIAQAVVDLLVARLEGRGDGPRTITIRGDMVERKSAAAWGG